MLGNMEALEQARKEHEAAEEELQRVKAEELRGEMELRRVQEEREGLLTAESRAKAQLEHLARERAALQREALDASDTEASLKAQQASKEKELQKLIKQLEDLHGQDNEAAVTEARQAMYAAEAELQKIKEKAAVSQLSLQHIKEKIEKLRRKLERKDIEKAQVLLSVKSKEATLTEEIKRVKEETVRLDTEGSARLASLTARTQSLSLELTSLRLSGPPKPAHPSPTPSSAPTAERLAELNSALVARCAELEALKGLSVNQMSWWQTAVILLVIGFALGLVCSGILATVLGDVDKHY